MSMSFAPANRLSSERYAAVRIIVDTNESLVIANWTATQHCDPAIVAVPFRPDIEFRSYLLRSQLAARDTHATFFVSRMRAAFKSL